MMNKNNKINHSNLGQALVEYVMVMVIVGGVFAIFFNFMPKTFSILESPIKKNLPLVYKYGDPKACGNIPGDPQPCDGTPKRHPAIRSADNFRIFSRGG